MTVPAHVWQRMMRHEALISQGWRCRYCKARLRAVAATAEHKKPRCKGGLTTRTNIAASCMPCNRAKASMTEGQFFALIKARDLPRGQPIDIILIWSTRRIMTRAERACRRIEQSVRRETTYNCPRTDERRSEVHFA